MMNDVLNIERSYPLKVELSNDQPLNVEFNSGGEPLPVEVSNDSPLSVTFENDPNVTPSTGKVNVILDNVVCRWVDGNNVAYHQIYPLNCVVYDVENINDGINLNSLMGAYKGMIEALVSVGITYSVTLCYHQYNSSNHVSWLNYGQSWTKS